MSLNLLPPQNILPSHGTALNHGPILAPPSADKFFTNLLDQVPWQHDIVKIFGKTITTARKVAWYGEPQLAYTYSGITKEPLPWSSLLLDLKSTVEQSCGESFNSCLLNLYLDGSQGMSWHRDNESSIVKDSPIACLSFGAERRFHFKHCVTKERITTILEHGSLLLMTGQIQTHWLHALPKMAAIKTPRISLTFRQMKTP